MKRNSEKMNEIREVARAYYEGAEEEVKESARQFFASLDENDDGKISLAEYKKSMNQCSSNDQLFQDLDEKGNKSLEFNEILALYYIHKVSIPSCNGCHNMLLGSYFSCLPCQGKDSYYLCCKCYSGGKFKHDHSPNQFVDNRALLKLLLDQHMTNDSAGDSVRLGQDTEENMNPKQENNDADREAKPEGSASGRRSIFGKIGEPLRALKGLDRVFDKIGSKIGNAFSSADDN